MTSLLGLLTNKWTLLFLIVSGVSLTLYLQKSEIKELNALIIQKDNDIKELTSSVNLIKDNQKKQEEKFKNQIEKIQKNVEIKISENQKLNEKIIKDARRNEKKIFENKRELAEKLYNKHIEINVEKWNKEAEEWNKGE